MKVVPIDASRSPESLGDFVQYLRSYKRDSIIAYGSMILWSLFQQKSIDSPEHRCIFKGIAPKIILLAFATGNNYRAKEVKSVDEFYDLCKQFLHIPVSIEDEIFLENEANKIQKELETTTIPSQYFSLDILRKMMFQIYVQRGVVEQNYHDKMKIEEFLTDYKILCLLDEKNKGIVSEILYDIFGLSLMQIYRSAWGLFVIARDRAQNGMFDLKKVSFDSEIKENLNVDYDTYKKVASKISCKESELRSTWYEKEVLTQVLLYQRYVPTPLNTTPIVDLDRKNLKNERYFIPAPDLFIRGFRQAIFSCLFKSSYSKTLGKLLGEVVELHIFQCLTEIFGIEKVKQIDHKGKKADFFIQMDNLDLVVEVKTDIGDALSKTVSNPTGIAKLWSRLFNACEQGKASLEHYRSDNRKIIFIVLVADYITAEYLSFQKFGYQSNLFKDMNIESVQFFSWAAFEALLWGVSLDTFEKHLINKLENKPSEFIREQSESNTAVTKPKFSYFTNIQKEFLGL